MEPKIRWNITSHDNGATWEIVCTIDGGLSYPRTLQKKEPTTEGGDGGWYYEGKKLLVQNTDNFSALEHGLRAMRHELKIFDHN